MAGSNVSRTPCAWALSAGARRAALPRRLVSLLRAHLPEPRHQRARVLARAGGHERLVVAGVELLEVADERTLGVVEVLAALHPALLEDRPQVPRLPAADVEC